ncbi:MAG TPA: hypothetical protein GXX23_08780 [Firmicutes bacterium]|nr:hypothetical protein [Candidatus Fermentithermobacillaceae bacterium]
MVLVALFLPVAVLVVGLVCDLGTVFCVRKLVQAACDLGALAGVQELDWELLAEGIVAIDEASARRVAIAIAEENLANLGGLAHVEGVYAVVTNPPDSPEPNLVLTVVCRIWPTYLAWMPAFADGIPLSIMAEASVVERTEW